MFYFSFISCCASRLRLRFHQHCALKEANKPYINETTARIACCLFINITVVNHSGQHGQSSQKEMAESYIHDDAVSSHLLVSEGTSRWSISRGYMCNKIK